MSVLVVTFTNCESSIEAVIEAARRHTHVFRLDADHFPVSVRLVVEMDGEKERARLISPDDEVDLATVTAAWFHQTYVGYTIPDDFDPRMRKAAQDVCLSVLQGMLASLDGVLVDPFGHADHKQVQLRVARQVGLEVPRTLLTNDPDETRAFAARCGGNLITKTPAWIRIDESDHFKKVYTSEVSAEDLEDLEGLRLCPMFFQEKLVKEVELRVVIVGERVFAVSVDSKGTPLGEVDWRRNASLLMNRWRPYQLPAEFERRLLALMDRLGLNFGAADVIVTPDGRHVFLEVNPNGGGFESLHRAGLPVAEAVADLLVGRIPRRKQVPTHVFAPGL